MTIMKQVKTRSGTTYLIDEEWGFWKKNDNSWERTHWVYSVPASVGSFLMAEQSEHMPLTVGCRMYIGNRELWWLSSVIDSITEVDIQG